jgi:hypothetical protein
MKLKLITAALVLATSGSAHALITDGTAGNGELFMTLLDEAGQQSYILDLNLTLNDFLGSVAMGMTYTYAADANMVKFLGDVAMDNKSGLRFAIGAMDSSGATSTDYHRYISTASVIDTASTVTNNNLKILGTNGNQMLADVNADIGANASLIITDPSRPGYAGSALWGDNWGGAANIIATGKIGSGMDLYLLRQSSGTFAARNSASVYEALTYNGMPVMASLDGAGNLHVAAIPEPETYALMLAGLGLVGWMARRRKA